MSALASQFGSILCTFTVSAAVLAAFSSWAATTWMLTDSSILLLGHRLSPWKDFKAACLGCDRDRIATSGRSKFDHSYGTKRLACRKVSACGLVVSATLGRPFSDRIQVFSCEGARESVRCDTRVIVGNPDVVPRAALLFLLAEEKVYRIRQT